VTANGESGYKHPFAKPYLQESPTSDGGSVGMPLGKAFFSPSFGMLTDRFGVNWMVVVASKDWAEQAQAKTA
jgi:hypothetical protein